MTTRDNTIPALMATESPKSPGKLNICLVTTAFPRWHHDSRQHAVLYTAKALQSLGVGVRVIALHAPQSEFRELLESVEVIRIRYMWPERFEILQCEGGGLPSVWRKYPYWRFQFLFAALAQSIATVLYARDCDIIHAHWNLSAMSVWASYFLHRCPYVVTVHGSDVLESARIPLVRQATQLALRGASQVIAVSQSLADATVALGIPVERIQVIHNGIDIEQFHPGPIEREPIVLFVGSLIARKGVQYLIRAMTQVKNQCPNCRLVIVGDGPQRVTLEQLTSQLDLAGHVIFQGAQSPQQVSEWMRRARLFVLPALEEALGIVLLEALASGTPCVATRVGGIPEIISSQYGLLVTPADSDALATAILSIMNDREKWQEMSRQARQSVIERCLTWEQMAKRLIRVYRQVLLR